MRLPYKKDLELRQKGWASYSGPWEAPAEVQALGHLYSPVHILGGRAHLCGRTPSSVLSSALLAVGSAHSTSCYPSSDSSGDRRTP